MVGILFVRGLTAHQHKKAISAKITMRKSVNISSDKNVRKRQVSSRSGYIKMVGNK